MKNGKKLIALLCMLFMTTVFMVPGISYGETDGPYLYFYPTKTVVRKAPGTFITVFVEEPVKGAKYTATVSNKKVAQLVDGFGDDYGISFDFYAKKSGKVTITINQTLNNETTVVGKKTITVKSKKFSSKNKKTEKLYQKVVKKGSKPSGFGVSMEVLQISNIKNTSNKVSAKVKLQHKVTAAEAQLAKKKGFSVSLDSKGYKYNIVLTGKLKKGSQYVNVSTSKKDIQKAKKATKKGTVYYASGMSTSKNTPYTLKIKL